MALDGRNFADDEAAAVGLVALPKPTDSKGACLTRLAPFVDKHPGAVAVTKRYLRAGALAEMRGRESGELRAEWLDAWFSKETRERIQQIVAGLAR